MINIPLYVIQKVFVKIHYANRVLCNNRVLYSNMYIGKRVKNKKKPRKKNNYMKILQAKITRFEKSTSWYNN